MGADCPKKESHSLSSSLLRPLCNHHTSSQCDLPVPSPLHSRTITLIPHQPSVLPSTFPPSTLLLSALTALPPATRSMAPPPTTVYFRLCNPDLCAPTPSLLFPFPAPYIVLIISYSERYPAIRNKHNTRPIVPIFRADSTHLNKPPFATITVQLCYKQLALQPASAIRPPTPPPTMSRRESTPETQRKRSLSFGEDSSAEKRARRNDESAMRRDASREGSAGPSIVSLASSAGSHPPRRAVESNRGPNEPPLKSRQDYSTPPSSSPVSSASEQSPPRQESRRQAESSSSQRAARPTWQTAEPDRLDERWERRRDRERERERDDRDYDRDDRDRDDRSRDDRSRGGDSIERDHRDRELRAGSTASRAVTPSGFSLGAGLNAPPAKTQAAFVGKLYSMLEDEKITKSGLLYWSQDGTSFVCPNPTEFSK